MRFYSYIACSTLVCFFPLTSTASENQETFRDAIEADWVRQENRKERGPDNPQAISDQLRAADRLLENLLIIACSIDLQPETAALDRLRAEARILDPTDKAAREKLYHEIRWMCRAMILKNPLVASRPILFMTRRRFVCQMLHEYVAYYYDYADIAGGGIRILLRPGQSFQTTDLIGNRLPRGNYTTLALSHDARAIYFAFAERADKKPDYFSPERRCFHIHAMDADGENLRQLTHGLNDDFDPCPLPDGGIVFMSSRRGGFTRCNNPWEPLPAQTLHRMDADGQQPRALSFHETNEWHPSVLNDGRIVYIRWDYVDRSAANYHGLWISNPDGSNPVALFGNYTQQINACYQPHAIPGSNRIAFLAGAHHADVGGSLVIVDPDRLALDPKTGQDRLESIEMLTPEVCFPESVGWPKSYFHSPWPLSEDYFLLAFSFDPLPGMGGKENKDTETGIYYFDRFGNMELLYREKGISSMYPIPLEPRRVPPIIPSTLAPSLGDRGEFLLANVNRSHFPLPSGRPIRQLRIYQVLPKSETHIANQPRIGYANAESARMLLGTVPVEADGSAYFTAPARKPLYFQAVDEAGRAVQTMRSVTYLQPGERRGCLGCHEPRNETTAANRPRPLAAQRLPSPILPGPDGTRPLSFPLLVQPVLDRNCLSCHDGSEGDRKSSLLLAADESAEGPFSKAYENLAPFVRWYEWGGKSIEQIVTRPGRGGADESPLLKTLGDPNHADVRLSAEDARRLSIWLDANAPYYGVYEPGQRLAQKKGESVAPPYLQ